MGKYKEVVLTELPDCDICTAKGAKPVKPAKFDDYHIGYGHSYACHTHHYEYAPASIQLTRKLVKA